MNRPIHPFPARMASELALEQLNALPPASTVLDPMAGSGTVLRHALGLGHKAIGFDVDPLAVLMSRVWTTPCEDELLGKMAEALLAEIALAAGHDHVLPWIDEDPETRGFVEFWFAERQRRDLRAIAAILRDLSHCKPCAKRAAALDVFRLALSRIIITKDRGASLGRDVSHSRPHRVADESDFDVNTAFARSIDVMRARLARSPGGMGASMAFGDARRLTRVPAGSVDAVITSPPYLNAIDYLRGHRLALVWLGFRVGDLRIIRAGAIGSERGPRADAATNAVTAIKDSMGAIQDLPRKFGGMVERYADDVWQMVGETARVLRTGGNATFVIGDSCLRGVYVRNSEAVATAATLHGLRLTRRHERPLPIGSRYLPMTSERLAKRMRMESVLTFRSV